MLATSSCCGCCATIRVSRFRRWLGASACRPRRSASACSAWKRQGSSAAIVWRSIRARSAIRYRPSCAYGPCRASSPRSPSSPIACPRWWSATASPARTASSCGSISRPSTISIAFSTAPGFRSDHDLPGAVFADACAQLALAGDGSTLKGGESFSAAGVPRPFAHARAGSRGRGCEQENA
jgi:hypothetical protein